MRICKFKNSIKFGIAIIFVNLNFGDCFELLQNSRNDNGKKFEISKIIQSKFGRVMPTIFCATSIR
ncbi:MAG: hypothetical protein IJR18_00945 [Campylobacter sp.]|nr:hypothetical protein [Campylobacter sp.]MBQ7270236.1 hypothetical protein [Campylobacter sp.]